MNDSSIRHLSQRLPRLITLTIILPLLLAPAASALADTSSNSSNASSAPPQVMLYATTHDWEQVVRLDPATLKNADVPPVDTGVSYPSFDLSADGSTFVRVDYSAEGGPTAIIQGGINGPERNRFSIPGGLVGPELSADGSRLLLQTTISCSPSRCRSSIWRLFNTADGQLLGTVALPGDRGFGEILFDPSGRRLYNVTDDPTAISDGPWPLTMVTYDLTSGTVAARLNLPSILGGTMYKRSIDQVPVADVLSPAIALSPDGTRIAIVHADSDQLTLIDTQHLNVLKTIPLARPESILDRLFSWLAPQTAEAKYMTGVSRSAVFSPDGHSLYVYGRKGFITIGDHPAEHGLGVERVDVQSGTIKATALHDILIDRVLPSPDGNDVYLYGPDESWTNAQGEPSYTLRRVGSDSLDTRAERTFADSIRILIALAATT